jgi:hypothetical protein
VDGLVARRLVRVVGGAYVAYAVILLAISLARATAPWSVHRWWDVALLVLFLLVWPVVFPGFLVVGGIHGGGQLWDPAAAALSVLTLAWALIGWAVALSALARRLRSRNHRAVSSLTKGESPR